MVSSVDSRSSLQLNFTTSSSRGMGGHAMFAVLPCNGVGICVLTNTANEAKGSTSGGGGGGIGGGGDFCHQVMNVMGKCEESVKYLVDIVLTILFT